MIETDAFVQQYTRVERPRCFVLRSTSFVLQGVDLQRVFWGVGERLPPLLFVDGSAALAGEQFAGAVVVYSLLLGCCCAPSVLHGVESGSTSTLSAGVPPSVGMLTLISPVAGCCSFQPSFFHQGALPCLSFACTCVSVRSRATDHPAAKRFVQARKNEHAKMLRVRGARVVVNDMKDLIPLVDCFTECMAKGEDYCLPIANLVRTMKGKVWE